MTSSPSASAIDRLLRGSVRPYPVNGSTRQVSVILNPSLRDHDGTKRVSIGARDAAGMPCGRCCCRRLLIKLDGGPVLYRQSVGEKGRAVREYKLRRCGRQETTMCKWCAFGDRA